MSRVLITHLKQALLMQSEYFRRELTHVSAAGMAQPCLKA